MLEHFVTSRAVVTMATGKPEILLNPTTFLCPFKSNKSSHTFRHACNTNSNIGKLFEGPSSHLLLVHGSNPAAKILIARLQYAKKYPNGKRIDEEAGELFLCNEWLMDEANDRGEANGYEELAEELFCLKSEAADFFDLPFTSAYADKEKKLEWVMGREAATAAAAEAAVEAGLAAGIVN